MTVRIQYQNDYGEQLRKNYDTHIQQQIRIQNAKRSSAIILSLKHDLELATLSLDYDNDDNDNNNNNDNGGTNSIKNREKEEEKMYYVYDCRWSSF